MCAYYTQRVQAAVYKTACNDPSYACAKHSLGAVSTTQANQSHRLSFSLLLFGWGLSALHNILFYYLMFCCPYYGTTYAAAISAVYRNAININNLSGNVKNAHLSYYDRYSTTASLSPRMCIIRIPSMEVGEFSSVWPCAWGAHSQYSWSACRSPPTTLVTSLDVALWTRSAHKFAWSACYRSPPAPLAKSKNLEAVGR